MIKGLLLHLLCVTLSVAAVDFFPWIWGFSVLSRVLRFYLISVFFILVKF